MPPIDPSAAAEAYRLTHECHRTLSQVASALGIGTYDVGLLLTAHVKALAAGDKLRMAKAGEGPPLNTEALAREHRERALEVASRLVTEGVDAGDISERLHIDRRLIVGLPEYRSQMADNQTAPRRAAAVRAKPAGRVPARPTDEYRQQMGRLAAAAQQIRGG